MPDNDSGDLKLPARHDLVGGNVRTQSGTTIRWKNTTGNPGRLNFWQLGSYNPVCADVNYDVVGLTGASPPPTLDPVITVRP